MATPNAPRIMPVGRQPVLARRGVQFPHFPAHLFQHSGNIPDIPHPASMQNSDPIRDGFSTGGVV